MDYIQGVALLSLHLFSKFFRGDPSVFSSFRFLFNKMMNKLTSPVQPSSSLYYADDFAKDELEIEEVKAETAADLTAKNTWRLEYFIKN